MSLEASLKQVDQLLAVQKTLVGGETANWGPGRNPDKERRIRFPLEIAGETPPEPYLDLTAPREEPNYFSISLIFGICVWRLDIVSNTQRHSNPLPKFGDEHPAEVWGSHVHTWTGNRSRIETFTKLQRLHVRHPYSGSARLMPAFRWACGELNIMVPHGTNIALPSPELLA